jgi:hypothetical protein
MNAHLILFVITCAAVWVGFLYVAPFGRCGKCKGTGHIKRGKRRVKVCHGARDAAASSASAPAPCTGSPGASAKDGKPQPDTRRTSHERHLADNR